MMKHIKKKFLFEDIYKNLDLVANPDFEYIDAENLNKDTLKRASKSNFVIIQTTENESMYAAVERKIQLSITPESAEKTERKLENKNETTDHLQDIKNTKNIQKSRRYY